MKTSYFTAIASTWNYLKGNPDDFSLQSRIYNSVCLVTILVIGYNVPFSLVMGDFESAFPFAILLCFQVFLYYLSRFRQKLLLSFVIYSVLINLFFAYNYFINGGAGGSTLLSFCITYFLIIAIVPPRQFWIWTIANLGLVLFLLYYEFKHPGAILKKYGTGLAEYVDQGSTYAINIILILCCLSYIRNNYNEEKRKAEEKALLMKELNGQKDKLISIISHDFSSPLTNIQVYLNILKKKDIGPEDRKMLEADLYRTTLQTQELLNNLLIWTKTQLEYTGTALSSVNVNSTLINSMRLLQDQAREKGLPLRYEIDDEVEVIANKIMLDVVFRNLINNAIKFTEKGGEVRVACTDEGSWYLFAIADNGTGMDDEQKKSLFSLDVQSTYGTSNEKGVGLGLAICKEFVDAQKAEIWLDSRKGEGTSFYLKFRKFDSSGTE